MATRIKGMYDILPPESLLWRRIENAFRTSAAAYGFGEARTPIVEHTELFTRSLGDTTDIVEKEMYTFKDKSERSLTLRPEGTASMVRAYVENKVFAEDALAKWVYLGPMYRYERPQKGRNRQFHQLGAEVFGAANAETDAELVAMAMDFFKALGLEESVSLELNSLGDPDDRKAYRETLLAFLGTKEGAFCEDCQRRIATNPLRVLDCKNPACQEANAAAPLLIDHLGDGAKAHFARLTSLLDALGIRYRINPRIVRGLDYYNRTAFEFKGAGLGAQDAVGGGGRYDGLVKEMGGPETPAVGFAFGLERLALLLDAQNKTEASALDFYFIPMGEAASLAALPLARKLRAAGATGEVDASQRRLKHLFARAERLNVRYALIMGDDELAKGVVLAKNLASKEQHEIAIDALTASALR